MEALQQRLYLALIPILFSGQLVIGQQTFFDLDQIQKIEIFFSQPNWDYQMDTAKYGHESYLMAEWVKVNGVDFDSAGVKYKGSSSYDSTYLKNPLHISLDEFKDQAYQGISSIKLANCFSDPSMIREVLGYQVLKNYMDCSRSNFAQVYINGSYIGLYSNDESVNKTFCSNHFNSSLNTFIKCNPESPGPFSKSNLKYISADSSAYSDLYEIQSSYGWNELISVCNTITNVPANLAETIDVDRAIWMIAFNNILVNLDSYSGWFSQNHYLYKDNTGHFNPIVWDLNMAFGGFPFAGSSGGGSGSLNLTNMQHLTPLLHATDSDWPLIKNILANPVYKKMYIAHLRTIANENFASDNYKTTAQQLQALIDTAVQSDENKFYSYDQFINGMTGNVTIGNYEVPGIATLMDERVAYLLATPEFSSVPPVILSVNPNNPDPAYNSELTITAKVISANPEAVFLGYRTDKAQKFETILMYDDGAHNDTLANDNIFGASFTMSSLQAEYYIYAENNEAAIFSPERAEHEFFTINATVQITEPGQVVINEFLAKNNNDTINEFGNHEDWIEFYNTTESPVNLFGLYLTDDFSNPAKFAFAENTIIQPNSFLVVWADEEDNTDSIYHCNFKLSANGEVLMLSDGADLVFDSLTFGAQTADISIGRCPDGAGAFNPLPATTFNDFNCSTGITTPINLTDCFSIFPNPANTFFRILNENKAGISNFQIINTLGQHLTEGSVENEVLIDVSPWPAGIYFIRFNQGGVKKMIIRH
jgi:hypothetical protein